MTEMTIVSLPVQATLVIRERVALSELTSFFSRAFAEVAAELARQSAVPSGPPVATYQHLLEGSAEVEAGYPVGRAVRHTDHIVVSHLPGGPAVQCVHAGAYDTLPATYEAMEKWIRAEGLHPGEKMWESYLVGPADADDPAAWRTQISWPVL